jgi:hypothetical protein
MRDRLLSLPIWALFLVIGVPCFAVMFAIELIVGDDLQWSLISAALFGVLAGAATTFGFKLSGRMEKSAFGDASVDVRREARRAVRTGPVPADPAVRAAALRLAEFSLQRLLRTRPVLIVCAAVVVVGTAVTALDSPWSLLLLAIYAPAIAGMVFLTPRRLRARIALLSEPQEPVRRTQ